VASAHVQLIRAQLRSQASYRTSFVIDVAGNLVVVSVDLLALLVMFRVTPTLAGFSVREAVFLFALANTGFALADLAVGSIERIRTYVRTGLLDGILVRPLGVLPQLLALDVGLHRIGRFVASTGLLGVAVALVDIDWTPARAVLFALTPLAGAVFFAAIFVASATVAFWWIESGEIGNSLTYGGRDFTSYPITVYGGWFRRLFAYGLGFGFVAYYPALALLGWADPLGLPAWVGWTSPLVAVAAASAAAAVWRVAIRHYRSTGS
jgi:viologen exporter family transport system permease protein